MRIKIILSPYFEIYAMQILVRKKNICTNLSGNKVKVAILGAGRIATDLLIKVIRSSFLECSVVVSRSSDSKGIKVAIENNIPVAFNSIKYFIDNPDCCDIVFDTTTAKAHLKHAPILNKLNKFVVDLTPSGFGKICVPILNANECMTFKNVNMITCSGQATIPVISEILKIQPDTEYIEVVTSASSISVGMATRENFDEYIQTTKNAAINFSGLRNIKVLALVNPAKPPVTMLNTIYAIIKNPDMKAIKSAVEKVVNTLRKYVPGYKLVMEPTFQSGKIILMIGVEGLGDYLPKFAGNLDIINCAAINIAERFAQKIKKKDPSSISLVM